MSDRLGQHHSGNGRAQGPTDRSWPVRRYQSPADTVIGRICHAFVQGYGKKDRAAKYDCQYHGTDPWQQYRYAIRARNQQRQRRHTLDRHRKPDDPRRAALVFNRHGRSPVDTDGRQQRIVHQLHEPDDTDHDTRRDEIQDQLQHDETLGHAQSVWLTEPMSEAESPAHNHSYGHEVQAALAPISRELRELIPDIYKGFGGLHAAAFKAGALDAKTKELVALAIAITTHCDGCIAAHAKGAARNGASDEEVAELIGVTISMNGGPGTVYGPRAFAAFREFKNG